MVVHSTAQVHPGQGDLSPGRHSRRPGPAREQPQRQGPRLPKGAAFYICIYVCPIQYMSSRAAVPEAGQRPGITPAWPCAQGGWETDEDVEAAAARETVEEAGVRGRLEASASWHRLPESSVVGLGPHAHLLWL